MRGQSYHALSASPWDLQLCWLGRSKIPQHNGGNTQADRERVGIYLVIQATEVKAYRIEVKASILNPTPSLVLFSQLTRAV